ncbi:MAG: allophanate hydrolase [Verrucomicrobiota bacterium]
MNDLSGIAFTIRALQKGYREKEFSPVDVVREVYQRIERSSDNPIWIHLIPQSNALRSAEMLANDTNKPLYGIPFAVKDNIDVADIPTTAGCPAFSYVPKVTATVVQRLLDAGAILIGKTNLDQFATGLVGVRSPYGACHSVFHSDYISGGSSSGSAVAVAAGSVSFALGTDTAGSGRVPAAFNNIVGLKPTRGLFSAFGVVPACRSLDCVSSLTLTAGDAEIVLSVAAAYDPRDPYSRRLEPWTLFPGKVRIAVLSSLDLVDEPFRLLYRQTVERMEKLGHSTVEIDITPFLDIAKLLYGGPWVAERFAAVGTFIEDHPDAVHPVVRDIILGGREYSAVDAFEAQYMLERFRQETVPVWANSDVLLLPTAPTIFKIDEIQVDPIARNSRLGIFTNFMNLLDLAGVAMPAGFSDRGLPFGVTLVGPAFSDVGLLELAEGYLQSLKPTLGGTKEAYPAAEPSTFDRNPKTARIAVVGAHLSGLPLNHQLTGRGAKLIETTETAPEYRFYALPDTNPRKPGLIRTEPGGGASITVEIWELTHDAFGSFVADVPSPLAIGTLRLQDGRLVKGFLCESVAAQHAEDISQFGGWRKYLEKVARPGSGK